MATPVEYQAGLVVGTIEAAAPDFFSVLLDTDAPQATALNTGTPSRFPRINGYVLVPSHGAGVVCRIAWVGVEKSAFPKRQGLRDFGLIDLPYPLRKMKVVPVGMLEIGPRGEAARLRQGVTAFPSVGDLVLLPTADELRSIIESVGVDRRMAIGTSPLSEDATVAVDPDKLFGRHAAVLGNTGSGKSCTIAGLVRWAVSAAADETGGSPAPRFIILDPNGEYEGLFSDLPVPVTTLKVGIEVKPGQAPLHVPAWTWNSHEWFAFTAASARTQQPVLQRALQQLRAGESPTLPPDVRLRHLALRHSAVLHSLKLEGPTSYATSYGPKKGFWEFVVGLSTSLGAYAEEQLEAATREALQSTEATVAELIETHRGGEQYPAPIPEVDLEKLIEAVDSLMQSIQGTVASIDLDPDVPVKFPLGRLPGHIEFLAQQGEFAGSAAFISYLTIRIRRLLRDSRIKEIIDPSDSPSVEELLSTYLGTAHEGRIVVVDLSLVRRM